MSDQTEPVEPVKPPRIKLEDGKLVVEVVKEVVEDVVEDGLD